MNAGSPQAHSNDLLAHGRCGRCAEKVTRAAILRRAPCSHCGSELSLRCSGNMLNALATRRFRWRIIGYGLVAATSFLAGTIPLLQIVVQLLALYVLHVIVLRGGLRWLPRGRRILTRISMKLLGAAIAATALVINVAVAPLLGASAVILAGAGPLLTATYVEGSLVFLRRRLRWEAAGDSLHRAEWLLPVGLVGALVAVIAVMSTLAVVALHMVATADIPTVSETSQFLLDMSQ